MEGETQNEVSVRDRNDSYPDVLSRDWEREPLLSSVAGQRQGQRVYGS